MNAAVETGRPDLALSPMLVGARDVVKTLGACRALNGVSLDIARGEVVCIVGPSGSGKTTFLRCLAGLEAIDAGAIDSEGERIGFVRHADGRLLRAGQRDLARQRARIGFVFQRFNLWPHKTALQNITAGPIHVLGQGRAEAEHDGRLLLRRVGLLDKAGAYPNQLSGGQQQRVAIARALAMRPVLMLFDECTSALDPEMVAEVLAVILELAQSGMTMLAVTHEMSFARRVADRIAMMDEGRMVALGTPEQFFGSEANERTQRFLATVARST
jgi:polar amino acid transport system ATP-binding protein